jgi:carboxymethylenebutenolidase
LINGGRRMYINTWTSDVVEMPPVRRTGGEHGERELEHVRLGARRHARAAAVMRARAALARLLASGALLGALALAGCASLVTAAEDVGTWGWHPDHAVVHADTAYTSGGARVAVERFAPRTRGGAAGRHPAVLVLHSSDGVRGPSGAIVRRWADALARHGYVAYVVHYFDRTGDTRTDDAREDAVFPQWTAALEDAVTFARHDAAVDSTRISAFGLSLGGYMALALGAADPRVDRLVVLSGGFFDALAPTVRRLPPTLLLHGSDDDVVPLSAAQRVDSTLARLHVPHALVVYPGRGHGLDAETRPDGIRRTLSFLGAHRPRVGARRASAHRPGA